LCPISDACRFDGGGGDSYDKHLFEGRTLQQLPDDPRFVFCATNLQTGVLWRFSKPYAGDYVVGQLDQLKPKLAQAVAHRLPKSSSAADAAVGDMHERYARYCAQYGVRSAPTTARRMAAAPCTS
jgi:hypothetical protein